MATIIEMPKLSDTMSVGTLVKWHKKIGETVENGDILAEVETDKATMELENFDDGTLLELFVNEGDEVPIGSPLAVVGEPGEKFKLPTPDKIENVEDAQNKPDQNDEPEQSALEAVKDAEPDDLNSVDDNLNTTSTTKPIAANANSERIHISPLAKKMALELNLDLKSLKGSGPNGRIVKKDIESISALQTSAVKNKENHSAELSTTASNDAFTGSDKLVPVSKMRTIIARRLLESKSSIPHFYLQKEINASPLQTARLALNSKLAKKNAEVTTKLTLNDIVLKACAETIPLVPEINSSWEGENIKFHGGVHLAFGVAIEDGLVTPVIRNANSMNLEAISIEAKSLIKKARSKKLNPDEMAGSTFTVTNLGMFGIDFFSGIINPPNAAILSVGAIVKKPIVNDSGNLQVGETMMLGLSCDHRLVDGAIAASFLQSLAETLENPASMLV